MADDSGMMMMMVMMGGGLLLCCCACVAVYLMRDQLGITQLFSTAAPTADAAAAAGTDGTTAAAGSDGCTQGSDHSGKWWGYDAAACKGKCMMASDHAVYKSDGTKWAGKYTTSDSTACSATVTSSRPG